MVLIGPETDSRPKNNWSGSGQDIGPTQILHPNFVGIIKEHYKDFNINIVTGQRCLDGFIGSSSVSDSWLQTKITFWLQVS